MVLENMPRMESIFKQSAAYADGFGGSIIEKRILDGDTGPSKLTLLHSGSGEITSPTSIQIDTITFGAGTFEITGECVLAVTIDDKSSGGQGTFGIRAADKFGSSDWGFATANRISTINASICQKPEEGNRLIGLGIHLTTVVLFELNTFILTEEDVITKEWTLSLRGSVNTGGTLFYRWWVYKRGPLIVGEG